MIKNLKQIEEEFKNSGVNKMSEYLKSQINDLDLTIGEI